MCHFQLQPIKKETCDKQAQKNSTIATHFCPMLSQDGVNWRQARCIPYHVCREKWFSLKIKGQECQERDSSIKSVQPTSLVVQSFQLDVSQSKEVYSTDLWWSDSHYHPTLQWRGGKRLVQGWSEIGFPLEQDRNWWLLPRQTGLQNPPRNQGGDDKEKPIEHW